MQPKVQLKILHYKKYSFQVVFVKIGCDFEELAEQNRVSWHAGHLVANVQNSIRLQVKFTLFLNNNNSDDVNTFYLKAPFTALKAIHCTIKYNIKCGKRKNKK